MGEADREATLKQWRQAVERADYEAKRAERRYRAIDPDNRLVARGLEREWEQRLVDLQAANKELVRRLEQRPCVLDHAERERLVALGTDLAAVCDAATATPRDQKELLRTLVEEVILSVDRTSRLPSDGALEGRRAKRCRCAPAALETRHLSGQCHRGHPQSTGTNDRSRPPVRGQPRRDLGTHWRIPRFQPKPEVAQGDIMTIAVAAAALNVAPSTLQRWLNDDLIAGEQVTPGALWRIRITDDLRARFTASAGEGFITMQEATRALGVTRQTVLQRVGAARSKQHVTKGGKVGLRIKLADRQPSLFEPA